MNRLTPSTGLSPEGDLSPSSPLSPEHELGPESQLPPSGELTEKPGKGAPPLSQSPLVSIRDLSVCFATGESTVRAVDGIDLDIFDGETVALVGESGCGKTTVARALLGLVKPTQGKLYFDGKPLGVLGTRERDRLCRELQMIFQDPDASLNPRRTLLASIAEPLVLHERLSSGEREARVCELMTRVGLDPALRLRYPHELSGGQRQRVSIARALAVRPRLMVCDEAVSALDVSIQAQILNLLLDLQKGFGLTYLFITHDLGVVRYLADRIFVMYRGKIVESGAADDVLERPQHPYTQTLLSAVPSFKGKGRLLLAHQAPHT